MLNNYLKINNLKFKISQRGFIKLTKKTLVSIFAFWIVIVGSGLIYMFGPWTGSVEAVWFNDNWSYRQRIPIDTHTASETNVYNEISVDTATLTTDKLQADCDDLRFTKENGEILPYQIVSGCDSGTTVIRVGFDTMPIAPFNIYMYYGNPTAGAGSSTLTHSVCGNGCAEGTAASEEKAPSPVAYWKFDDGTGTNAQDSTVNNLDGTISGATWQTEDQCVNGKCLYFDGSSDYVDFGDQNKLDFSATDSFSVGYWFKTSTAAPTNGAVMFSKYRSGGPTQSFYTALNNSTNYPRFSIYDGSNNPGVNGATAANDGKWHYLVGVRNVSTDTLYLYIDGVLVGSTTDTTTGSLANSNKAVIGGLMNTSETGIFSNTQFTGFIDEPKIYNYARSAAQIQADYNARASGEGASAVLGAQTTAALNNGLVGYWKMDEASGNATDASGNGYTGTATGTTIVSGKFGNSRDFAGSTDKLQTSNAILSGTGDFTIAAWIKRDSASSLDVIGGNFGSSTCTTGVQLMALTSGKLQLWLGSSVQGATTLSASTWYHVVGLRSNGSIKLYVNGVEDGSGTLSGTIGTNCNWAIGNGPNYTTESFEGLIDEQRVYNRALSSNEVTQLYNFAPGPIGYWTMDEPSGNVSDKSGNALTGTVTGTTSVKGKFGKARSTNGTTDYIEILDNALLKPTTELTVEMWCNLTALSSIRCAISKHSDSGKTGYILFFNSDNKFYFQAGNGVTWPAYTTSTAAYSSTGWYHVAGVHSASVHKIYVNGIEAASAGSGGTITHNTSNLWIGRNTSTTTAYYAGTVDEVKIYNYALTQKQIVSDMNAGHPSVGSPIASAIGHWKFDEGTDNTCSGGTNDVCNSGNGGSTSDGANTNMASPATSTSGWTQSGKFGRALNFDGTDDYVDAGGSASVLGLTEGTFTVWVKISNLDRMVAIAGVGNGGTDTSSEWSLQFRGDATRYLQILSYPTNGSAANLNAQTPSNTIATTGWHHIAVTVDSSNLKVYVDGVSQTLSGTVANKFFGNASAATKLVFGRKYQSTIPAYFEGAIDDVKVYNYPLTADEVKVDMNRGSNQVLGTISDKSTYEKQAANQEYCIPGDSTSCAAPVGRWDFEEGSGTSANDSSGKANIGTITAGTGSYTSGKTGKAYSFDNANTKIDAGSASALDDIATTAGQDFTAEVWIKPTSVGENSAGVIIGKAADATPTSGWLFQTVATNALKFSQSGGTVLVCQTANSVLTLSSWNHVAVTWTGAINASTVSIYVNGVKKSCSTATDGATLTSDAASSLIIGNETSQTRTFDGKIDAVRIFNYARSSAQVAWDYNKGAPVGYWKMDDCQGTAVNDSSGNGYHGTLTIGAGGGEDTIGTCTTSSTAWGDGASGKINYSLSFGGTDDYVTGPVANFINNNQLTMSAWVYSTSWPSFGCVICAYDDTTSPYALRIDDGRPMAWIGDSAGADNGNNRLTTTGASSLLSTSAWHHIVAVYDGSQSSTDRLKIYINKVRASGTISGTIPATATTATKTHAFGRLGSTNSSQYFVGKIDDIRIYNYALTTSQINNLYNQSAVSFKPLTGAP